MYALRPGEYVLKFLKIMRLGIYLVLLTTFTVSANGFSQKVKVTLNLEQRSILEIIKELRKVSDYQFLYRVDELRKCGKRDLKVQDAGVEEVMRQLLDGTHLTWRLDDDVILIKTAPKTAAPAVPQKVRTVQGVVSDTKGGKLPGVTVILKGTTLGGVTDAEGNFKFEIPDQKDMILVFSFVGMQTKEVPYKGESEIKVTLQTDVTEMEQVVVTGIFTRKTESYTGAATTIKKEELQKMGNQNVLQSLKSLDPAFHIIENNDFGSDPNKAPQIQLRGQQSMPDIKGTYNGNPNQPLFILDGFETDITTVYDLDMNRVETIVLLKDAAAKAIYGAKAANGVVVIETRQPKAGKMRISYKGDLSLTIPDLTGYNLCDAREKYEVDKAHGRYSDPWFWEQYLNQIKSEIERGVDTDWLAQPLHTGIGHRHSLYLDGGDEHLRYGVDLLYNEIKGVMKGSDRQTFTGGITLAYRYKDLLFRNQLSTTLNRANDSPYGSFDEYAKLNPYWTPYDENGDLKQIAGSTGGGGLVGVTCGNPLWNASIGTKNFSKYT